MTESPFVTWVNAMDALPLPGDPTRLLGAFNCPIIVSGAADPGIELMPIPLLAVTEALMTMPPESPVIGHEDPAALNEKVQLLVAPSAVTAAVKEVIALPLSPADFHATVTLCESV